MNDYKETSFILLDSGPIADVQCSEGYRRQLCSGIRGGPNMELPFQGQSRIAAFKCWFGGG